MKVIVFLLMLSLLGMNLAYAEPILITLINKNEDIVFDGRWTFKEEWKGTSETIVDFNNSKLAIRTAHDYENLFIFIETLSDTSIQRFSDMGIVCIDSKMDGGTQPKNDDYCFLVTAGSDHPITLQGGHFIAKNGFYKKIPNHPKLIAIGGILDENDRYSKTETKHMSYEFRIPLEIITKSDMYGFYVGTYDAKTGIVHGWPTSTAEEKYPYVPSPDRWGQLVSPDKSIPEFELPALLLLPLFSILIILSKRNFLKI